jgi:hypothetical protein
MKIQTPVAAPICVRVLGFFRVFRKEALLGIRLSARKVKDERDTV